MVNFSPSIEWNRWRLHEHWITFLFLAPSLRFVWLLLICRKLIIWFFFRQMHVLITRQCRTIRSVFMKFLSQSIVRSSTVFFFYPLITFTNFSIVSASFFHANRVLLLFFFLNIHLLVEWSWNHQCTRRDAKNWPEKHKKKNTQHIVFNWSFSAWWSFYMMLFLFNWFAQSKQPISNEKNPHQTHTTAKKKHTRTNWRWCAIKWSECKN